MLCFVISRLSRGLTRDLTSDSNSGFGGSLTGGSTCCLASGLTRGLTCCLTRDLTGGLTGGLTCCLASGLTRDFTCGLTRGLTGGLTGGLTVAKCPQSRASPRLSLPPLSLSAPPCQLLPPGFEQCFSLRFDQ